MNRNEDAHRLARERSVGLAIPAKLAVPAGSPRIYATRSEVDPPVVQVSCATESYEQDLTHFESHYDDVVSLDCESPLNPSPVEKRI